MPRPKRSQSQGSAPAKEEKAVEEMDVETPTTSSRRRRSSPLKEPKSSPGNSAKNTKQRKRKASHDTTRSTANSDHEDQQQQQQQQQPIEEEQEERPETMDVSVHRLRHLEFLPQPILCMRGTPRITTISDTNANNNSYLAISRESGSVELKAPQEKFRTVAEIAGFNTKPINAMAWTCQPTLVGGSRDGTLFVVDFASTSLTGVMASGGGGVFCLTSLCQCCSSSSNNSCAQLVAAGCEDGSIRIFRVVLAKQEEKLAPRRRELELVSILPSGSGAAVLSLAWRRLPNHTAGNGCVGTVLYAGLADGTIRRYQGVQAAEADPNSCTWKSSLRITVENQGRSIPTKVWALQALEDGTVVSGDSLGHVQFWDGTTGTMLQSFEQNDNKADVLDLVVASKECKVFASGVDSRVVCIQRAPPSETNNDDDMMADERKWILSQAQRPHTHDVKGMTICQQRIEKEVEEEVDPEDEEHKEESGGFREVLCTGGIDTKLCVYSVEKFKKSRPKSLYPWPAFSPVAQARKARVILIRREGKIDLYQLGRQPDAPITESYEVPEDDFFLGTIEVESTCNLACVTISDDGQFLAACDALSLLIFRLKYVFNHDGIATAIIPSKLSMGTKLQSSIVCLRFGRDDMLITASSDGSLNVIDMPKDETSDEVTVVGKIKQKKVRWGREATLFPTQSIEFSSDKQWFAAVRGGMGSSSVRVFSCEEDGSTYRHWWSVPDLEAPLSAVRFLAGEDSPQIVVACANFAFYLFDIRLRKLSPWSEDCRFPIAKHLPVELAGRNDYPIRITSNPASPNLVLLGSFGSFALIDLDKQLPKYCKYVPQHHVRRWRKRKLSEAETTSKGPDDVEATICLRYNSILHMDFIDNNEMVVVEQPWLSVIATFPPALERKLYGS